MASNKRSDGFSPMESHHVAAVQELDRRCNETEYSAKNFRSAVRDRAGKAFVLVIDGKVGGFVLLSTRSNPSAIFIDRIAANSAELYDRLLYGIFFYSEEMFDEEPCELIHASAGISNMILRGRLIANGFVVGPMRGHGELRRILFTKLMVESTWYEGTHYPFGTVVLEEIVGGDCRVLGTREEIDQ